MKGFHNVRDFAEFNEMLRKNEELQRRIDELQKKRNKSATALAKAEENLRFAASEQAKELAKVRVRTAELNKINRDNAKQTLGITGAYSRLNSELNKYRTAAKNAGAEMIRLEMSGQRSSAEYQKLNKEFQQASVRANSLDKAIKGLDSSLGQNQRHIGNYSNAVAGLGKNLIAGFGIVGGIQLFTSTLRSAFDMVRSFDTAMAELAGVLQIPKGELTEMRDLILSLGGSTAFTATQVAQASTELARLGFTQDKISASLEDIINGTIAFQAELPEVAELAAGTLNAFGLEASQTGELLNVLASSANKTAAGFRDFVVALPKVSKPASALGITIEETSALLGILRDNAIAAETAGTGLRNIFLQSAKAGITYRQALEQIRDSQNKLATATEMFGVQNATQALTLAENIDKIEEYTAAVTDQGGALEFLVDQQLNTIAGSLKLLESAWEGFILSIENGEGALALIFKSIIDGVTSLLTGFTNISKDIKDFISVFTDLFDSLGAGVDELNDKEFMPPMFANLESAIQTVQWFIGVLRDLTEGIIDNLKTSEGFNENIGILRSSFNQIREAIRPVINLFVNASEEGGILSIVASKIAFQIRIVTSVFAFFIKILADALSLISNLISRSNDLSTAIEYLSIAITSPTTAFQALYEMGKATLNGLFDLVRDVSPKIRQYLLDAINPFAKADISGILNDFRNYGNQITKASQNVFDAKKQQTALRNQVNGFLSIIQKGADDLDKLYQKTISKNNNDPTNPSTAGGSDSDNKEAKKRSQEYINTLQEELDFYIASNNLKNKSDEQSLQILSEIQRRREAILQAQRKNNLISETKYQTELIKLLDDSNKAQIDHLKNSLQQRMNILSAQYDLGIIPVNDLIEAEKQASDEKNRILQQQYDNGLISLEEYTLGVLNESKSLNDKLKKLYDQDAKRQFTILDNILKNFQVNNRSKLDSYKVLTNEMYQLEVLRMNRELELQKQALRAKYQINEQELNQRIKLGKNLTDNEIEYLNQIYKLNKTTADNIQSTYESSINGIIEKYRKERENTLENIPLMEQLFFGEGGQESLNLLRENIEQLTQEISAFGDVEEGSEDYSALQNKIESLNNMTNAYDSLSQEMLINAAVSRATTLESLEDGKSLLKQIIQTSVAYAVQNYIRSRPFLGFGGVALAAAVGIAVNSMLNSLLNSISFATGTSNAPYSGIARVDEKGPEIHTDKKGNIKSLGQNKGSRFTKIEKGDKIFTANQSKKMKQALETSVKYNHLNFDATPLVISQSDKIDYSKLGTEFLNALEKIDSKKVKEQFLIDKNGEIIIIRKKGNLTHYIRKKRDD